MYYIQHVRFIMRWRRSRGCWVIVIDSFPIHGHEGTLLFIRIFVRFISDRSIFIRTDLDSLDHVGSTISTFWSPSSSITSHSSSFAHLTIVTQFAIHYVHNIYYWLATTACYEDRDAYNFQFIWSTLPRIMSVHFTPPFSSHFKATSISTFR